MRLRDVMGNRRWIRFIYTYILYTYIQSYVRIMYVYIYNKKFLEREVDGGVERIQVMVGRVLPSKVVDLES